MSNDIGTMTLSDFLLARIAEDEEIARWASPGGWTFGSVDSVAGGMFYDETRTIGSVLYEQPGDHDGAVVRHLMENEADHNGYHIVRHDPARVLTDCEAKRRIVEEVLSSPMGKWKAGEPSPWADKMLGLLALPYADHPDYREEWRP